MPIDPASLSDRTRWTCRPLPLPRHQRSAKAFGFCGGFAAGESAGSGHCQLPQWWRDGQPQALAIQGRTRLDARRAHGRQIAGSWLRAGGANGGAAAWRLGSDGRLLAVDLHDDERYLWTAALGTGGCALVGYGHRRGDAAGIARPLFWNAGDSMLELPAPAADDAVAEATDGVTVAGRICRTGGQQAALWRLDGSGPTVLGDGQSISEAYGVDGEEQVGVRWSGRGSQAALWRGSAASFVDLTPRGWQSAVATDCASGLQVGHACSRDLTRGGSSSLEQRAALWAGTAASHFDLQAVVPEPWNASVAWAIEVAPARVLVAGALVRFAVQDALTSWESHVPVAQIAAVWEARLQG